MNAPQALVGGRYRLVRRIAAGGMGVVWEGWDEVLERRVAIKQLRTEAGVTEAEAERAKNRAMREARITARLHHAHAVPVFDAVKHEGQPCLVMQYVPSTALSALLRQRGPMPVHEVARIGAQVASALAAAHRLGIVHRDVKPGNILITDDGDALISDFGISHAFGDATVTSTGLVHGTPAYLAPEIARGAQSDFPSDVFSLGSTLYAATEGAPPFGLDSNSIALLHKVALGRFPPPVRSGALTPLLLEMLDPDPAARPSMADVATRLAVLQGVAAAEADRDRAPGAAAVPAIATAAEERVPAEEELPPAGGAAEPGPSDAVVIGEEPGSEEAEDRPATAATAVEPREPTAPTAVAAPEHGDHVPDNTMVLPAGAAAGAEPEQAAASAPEDLEPAPSGEPAAARGAPREGAPRTVEPLPWFVPGVREKRETPADAGPPAATPRPPRERLVPPPPAAVPATHAGRDRKDRRLLGILAAAVVAAFALIGGSLLLGQLRQGGTAGEGDSDRTPRTTAPASTPTPSPEPSTPPPTTPPPTTPPPTTPPPTTEPEPSPAPPAATREEQLAQAISGYYALMPGNTEAAWPLMTADYQTNHAGGRAAYERFWGAIAEVSVSSVRGIAPDAAEATVTYVYTDGRVVEERTAYRLVDEGGTLKIAATSVLSSRAR